MKQIAVLSGKGGTGKTSITAALADIGSKDNRLILVDADVDASNLGLLISPENFRKEIFFGLDKAQVNQEKCVQCGICEQVCRFDAVSFDDQYQIDPFACEGCGVCFTQCPEKAIEMVPAAAGEWYASDSQYGPFFHAELYPGQENSGKLVTLLKTKARSFEKENPADLLLLDGSPGIGCPVVASLTGMDQALLVVEPTLSGIHDFQRIYETCKHFRISVMVCINKADINLIQRDRIRTLCEEFGITDIVEIPYRSSVSHAVVKGVPMSQIDDQDIQQPLKELWRKIKSNVFPLRLKV